MGCYRLVSIIGLNQSSHECTKVFI